jgi:hypothetical protein
MSLLSSEMNSILNLVQQNPTTTTLKTLNDPIPTLINKLSSGEEIQVKIRTEYDSTFIKNNKKNNTILIPSNFENTNSPFPKMENVLHLLSNKRSPNFPTKEQKYLLGKLKSIPVYTIVNDKNEIIKASSRENLKNNSLSWIQEKYRELFFWSHDEGPVSISLFFMNKEDAASYLHEICKREPKDSEFLGLRLQNVGLDVFYKLNRTSSPKTQTRLIADLKEIGSVLKTHSHNSFCSMHPKQKYSNTWFQGNPIYIIKFQKSKDQKNLMEYTLKNMSEKKIIFFSMEDSLRAWKAYISKKPSSTSIKPTIEIYNLESLLLDTECGKVEDHMDLIFAPPFNYYKNLEWQSFSKRSSNYSTLERYIYSTKLKLERLQKFYKGLIWLFTSDTLPSEENSW